MANLLSTPTLVESPFIIAKIGDYTFGSYSRQNKGLGVTFPNYMQSVNITKINGTVNTYTLNMVYAITQYDDPNLLDRVFSTVGGNRKITLTYGDWNAPSYIFKEEHAIITKVTQNINFSGSQITYQINCVSESLASAANTFDFAKQQNKPSSVIRQVLANRQYGLLDVFKGMENKANWGQLIRSDDVVVTIEKKAMTNPLSYLNYLVSCMVAADGSKYAMTIVDDDRNEYGGSYFRVVKIPKSDDSTKPSISNGQTQSVDSYDTYDLDIGYPGSNLVTNFSMRNNEAWSLLYELADNSKQQNYVYRIGDNGSKQVIDSPNISTSRSLYKSTASLQNWWSKVTEYPVQASVTIKGLLRPAMLMTYVRINCYFYGNKYIASGLYIVTKQEDVIDSSGYRTTLSLTRIAGDNF